MKTLVQGQALPLSHRLSSVPDPVALYATLSEQGIRPGTLLIENSKDHTILVDAAAVRATCRGGVVHLDALTPNGEDVLSAVAVALTSFVEDRTHQSLRLVFPRATSEVAEERLNTKSPFDVLRALSTGITCTEPHASWAVVCAGVFAYDFIDHFEALPAPKQDSLDFPDFVFWLAESLIVIDRQNGSTRAICTVFGSSDPERTLRNYHDGISRLSRLVKRCETSLGELATGSSPTLYQPPTSVPMNVAVDIDDTAYAVMVQQLQKRIVAGDVFQIVASRTFSTPCNTPLRAYTALRQLNPSPMMFFVSGEDHTVFGASPETSVRVQRNIDHLTVEINPIAGTRPRGLTPDHDDRLEAELRLNEKELAEHMMLVDLARNDIARVSTPGTRRVARLLTVERYSHVMHMVSSVTGELRSGLDALHAVQACMNMGTLTGAPKLRATELLREVETEKRGPYGGAAGYLTHDGNLNTAIVIRSAVVKDKVAYVRAGAGVVYDSDPYLEADETRRKASAVLKAIHMVESPGDAR